MTELVRCDWSLHSELETKYHDEEWGRPARDDKTQFEFIILESAQAGLSWLTILKKRDGYRKLFKNFNPLKVARFGPKDVERLMADPSIIRNRLKIEAAVKNAAAFLNIAEEHGSFSNYLWSFVDGRPIVNHWKDMKDIPPKTPLSETISKELKKRGFTFMGPTVVYAHLQATGLVNDHLVHCFCRQNG